MGNTQKRAVIAGSSGFIGQRLSREMRAAGFDVKTIGRGNSDARWGEAAAIVKIVDGADVVINLAGKSVNARYTDSNRAEILRSRVDTTREVHRAIRSSVKPPRVWLNASTATIYRYAIDRPMTESNGEVGTGFSVDVARQWEAELFEGELPQTRRVALRMAIVLGDGPATGLLVTLARLRLGGPQFDGPWFPHRRYRGIGPHPTGDGRAPTHRSRGLQKFSWIHIDDVVGAIKFLVTSDVSGPVNLVAPNVSDNRVLMATLRRAVRTRIGLPAYRWMLEPAMWVLRTEPELVLKSRWVAPERLVEAGYRFQWTDLAPAIDNIVKPAAQP